MQVSDGHDNMAIALKAMLCKRFKNASSCGGADLSRLAIEQRRTDFFFKRADLGRDGRLGHTQLFRRAGKTTLLTNFQEGLQFFKIHAGLVPLSLFAW